MARSSHQSPSVKVRDSAGGKQYFIRYRFWAIEVEFGRPTRVRKWKFHALGLASEMTKAQAKAAAAEIMRKVNGQGAALQSHVPFEEFLEVYRTEHYRTLKPNSQVDYDSRINSWVLPAFKGMKLREIGTLEVTRLLGNMERAGIAKSTRRCTKSIVQSMFKQARLWGFLEQSAWNPAADAEVGRSKGNTVDIWTPTLEEAQRIIAATDETTGLILWFIIWTGMRISEVVGLRCKNVDLAEGVVWVRERSVDGVSDDPKSPQGTRGLPLGYLVEQLVPLMGQPDDFLFREPPKRSASAKLASSERTEIVRRREAGEPPKDLAVEFEVSVTTINATRGPVDEIRGGGCTNQTFYLRVRGAMESLGLYHPGNMYHAFRRLHAGLMARNLRSVLDLQDQLGHANIATTQLYVGDNIGVRKDALAEAQSKVIAIRRKA